MIEAHRRVDARTMRAPKTKTRIETTFLPDIFRPLDDDLIAIGRVATAFSILERVLGMAQCTRAKIRPDSFACGA